MAMAQDVKAPHIVVLFVILSTIPFLLAAPLPSKIWESDSVVATGNTDSLSFGECTDISPSGDTLVVGAPNDNIGPNPGTLSVYNRGPDGWEFATKLTSSSSGDAALATSVVITVDRIVAGAPFAGSGAGRLVPFTFSGGQWVAQTEIAGTSASRMGRSLATDGSILAAGAPGHDSRKGKVVIFSINGSGEWAVLTTLLGSTANNADTGNSVFISQNFILAGATDELNSLGALYKWDRADTTFTATPQRLTTDSQAPSSSQFGLTVAIVSDTTLAIGNVNSNIVYILTQSSGIWSQGTSLEAPAGAQSFGVKVAYSSNFLLVSSYNAVFVYMMDMNNIISYHQLLLPTGFVPTSYYAAYRFVVRGNFALVTDTDTGDDRKRTYSIGQKVFSFKLTDIESVAASGKSKSQSLGYRVALWNGIALISVPSCIDTSVSCDGGYINLYEQDPTTKKWKFLNKIRSPFRNRDVKFGYNMIVNDDYLIVSAPDSNYVDKDIGIIVLYTWNTDLKTFVKHSIIRYRKIDKNYDFGSAISNINSLIAIGMPEYDASSTLTNAGRAHFYKKQDNGKWGERVSVTTPTPVKDEHFGKSISLESETRVAISNSPSDSSIEGVYIFNFVNEAWTFVTKIADPDRLGFGWKVAFLNNLLYISAIHDMTAQEEGGSISVCTANAEGGYDYSYTLQPKSPVAGEHFGYSFSTDGTQIVVGAKPCNDGTSCNVKGSVYTFVEGPYGPWVQQNHFSLGAGDGSDGFGYDVAIAQQTILVSAPFSAASAATGTAYFIEQ